MKLAEEVELLIRIRELHGSNLGRNTDCAVNFRDFPYSLQKNSGTVSCSRSLSLPSTFFTIHNSLIILSFDTTYSELLKAS
jgi:hypothetical protein